MSPAWPPPSRHSSRTTGFRKMVVGRRYNNMCNAMIYLSRNVGKAKKKQQQRRQLILVVKSHFFARDLSAKTIFAVRILT